MEFEWKIFPGFTTVGILNQIQQMMGELQCEPENFTSRIIFMSMFNDIVWDAKGNDEICENTSKTLKEYAGRFPRGHWSFLGPGSEKKWYGTYDCKPDGSWDRTAEKMLLNFAGSGRPIFRGTSALERGEFRSKGRGSTTIHFTARDDNVQLLLKMIISVNQLSLYGAVADLIEELPVGQRAVGKPKALGQLDEVEILTQPPFVEMQANEERQGNLLQEYEQRFEKLSEDQNLSRLCSEAGLRLDNSSLLFRHQINHHAPENTMPRDQEGTRIKRWIQSHVRFGPVLDIKVCNHYGRYSIEVQVQSLFQDQTVSWIRIVNGIDKLIREAMPIEEEEKASGKPAAKARPITKPSSTSCWDFTLVEQRQWIAMGTQESNDPYCFQVSKFITDTVKKFIEKLMEQSIITKLLMNARKSNPTILDIGQTR